jgi:hypothetical protein
VKQKATMRKKLTGKFPVNTEFLFSGSNHKFQDWRAWLCASLQLYLVTDRELNFDRRTRLSVYVWEADKEIGMWNLGVCVREWFSS